MGARCGTPIGPSPGSDAMSRWESGRIHGTRSMSSIGRSPLVVTVMLLANVTPVLAQQARHRFWLGGGLGYGAASVSCDTCRGGQRLGGWTAAFEAGATLSPHVRVGAEWREWFNGLKPGGRLPSI